MLAPEATYFMKVEKIIRSLFLPSILLFFVITSCNKSETSIRLTSSSADTIYDVNEEIVFEVSKSKGINFFKKVDFYVDDILLYTAYENPYQFKWHGKYSSVGNHKLKAIAYTEFGKTTEFSLNFQVVDFRNVYIGDYDFVIYHEHFIDLVSSPTYDTLNYNGTIKIFSPADSENDYYIGLNDLNENPDEKITININGSTWICSILTKDGQLVEKTGTDYHHFGSFVSNDSIFFELNELNNDTDYYDVMGKKN